jgi:hypothetical protein
VKFSDQEFHQKLDSHLKKHKSQSSMNKSIIKLESFSISPVRTKRSRNALFPKCTKSSNNSRNLSLNSQFNQKASQNSNSSYVSELQDQINDL